MGKYSRLALEDRYQILALRKSGLSYRSIGQLIGRSASSILREWKRNSTVEGGYKASLAEQMARVRRGKIHPPRKIIGEKEALIRDGLSQQWSPEQIVGRLAVGVCVESVYRFIYRDARNGGILWKNLRRHRFRRRPHRVTKNFKRSGKRLDKVWIQDRPKIVEKRQRLGDIERDLVLGKHKNQGPALLTLVDRASRYTWIEKVQKVTARLVHEATLRRLSSAPVRTITNDNGSEFNWNKKTEKALGVPVFFNHPNSAWQRGTNENTNGLIRQYFPKNHNFRKVSDADVRTIEELINSRPRKTLGFKTPAEVQVGKSDVALRTRI